MAKFDVYEEVTNQIIDALEEGALLHKLGSERTSPFPGRTYPTGSVTGMPRAV